MDVQEAVAESQTVANADDNGDGRRDAQRKFTMGPNDSLEGKLVYDGSVHVDGRAEGEFRVTGNLDVASGAVAKISIDAANVTVKGTVEGPVMVKDKLTLGKNAKLSGDIVVRRLQIEDGASLNGHVRMGDLEQHASGG
jgi:cytoskeletal protein CcmA (bactofilin family)